MDDTTIRDERARTFATALQTFERDGDASALARLFAPDAVTERLDGRAGRRGEVEQFWQEYRSQFDRIDTTFSAVVEGGDRFALEWVSDATLTGGRPVTYSGVTVIDLDGDAITRLRTYYDSAAFTAPTAELAS
jgi:ketosteroid isomerase-like protein